MKWFSLFFLSTCTLFAEAPSSSLETIDAKEIISTCSKIAKDPYVRTMHNAFSQNPPEEVFKNWDSVTQSDLCFSHEVDHPLSISNQQRAGLCWMHAALNHIRIDFAKKHELSNFEFSYNYLFFFDKVEKANFFLEKVIHSYQTPLISLEMVHLLSDPLPDGGNWHNVQNLICKYGIVPKSVVPDTFSANNSYYMNKVISLKLLQCAEELREQLQMGTPIEVAREYKQECLRSIYHILVMHLGMPPENFDWTYYNSARQCCTYEDLTPRIFADKFLAFPFEDYVLLVNSPRSDTPFYSTYEVVPSSEMVGGKNYRAFNIPMDELKKITMAVLKNGESVYFACDVLKQMDRFSGALNHELYDLTALYNTDFSMSKGARLQYWASQANHSMLLSGVHIKNDHPIKWKVENSWGLDSGNYGHFVMSDAWFDEYVYEIVVAKKHLPEHYLELLDKPPVHLQSWDPMYSTIN